MSEDKLFELLSECPDEQQKDFVQQHYGQMRYQLQDPMFVKFSEIKQQFTGCEINLKNLGEEIYELEYARIKTRVLDNSDESNNDSNNDVDHDTNENSKQNGSAEDQVSEMLDNLSSATYEKNYKEAISYYQILKDMLKSETYGPLLKKQEIKKTIEQCYQTLGEFLLSDYENENPVFPQAELVQHLIQINQHQNLVQKFLDIKTKHLQESTKKYFNSTYGLDIDQLDKVCQFILKNILSVCEQFQTQFKELLQHNDYLFSQISSWIQDITFQFYNDISPSLFQSYDYEEICFFILNTVKDLIHSFNEFESSGLSLSIPLQKYLLPDFELKIDELFTLYGQKVKSFLNEDTEQLYLMFQIKSLNYCEDELLVSSLRATNGNENGKITLVFPQELKLKPQSTIRQILQEVQQSSGIACIYFWNICFKLMDVTLEFINPEIAPTLSISLAQIITNKIKVFITEFLKLLKLKLTMIIQPDEKIVVYQLGNFYSGFTFCNLLSQYITMKKAKYHILQNQEWVQITQMWYLEVRDVIQTFFNGKILEQIPYWLADQGRIYCQKIQTNAINIQKPSSLFLMISNVLTNVKQDLIIILPRQPLNYFLMQLNEQLKFITEYVIYWFYHNIGKNPEVFFMEKKERDKINLNMTQLNLYLQSNALKLSYFTTEGLKQFIYDTTFLGAFFNKYMIPSGQINNEQFQKKCLALYNKEKNINIELKPLVEQYQIDCDKYIAGQLDNDLIQFNQIVRKQNKDSQTNFIFH